MKSTVIVGTLAILLSTSGPDLATAEPLKGPEMVVQGGLIQPLLMGGGNVEVDINLQRFVISYSHGFALSMQGDTVVGEASAQGLALYLPFSTGLGVGYQVLDWLDIRGELKWHRFEVHYDDSRDIEGGELFSYDTFTVGAGAYAHWRPFAHRSDWLRGINTSTSVRYWPKVASSLDDGEQDYDNQYLGRPATHKASNIGIANTPFILNVSIGYAFSL